MPIEITGAPDLLTMVHVYETTPETQAAVFDGLCEGLRRYGPLMAGHVSSSVHRSVDGLRVTSYSQWDRERSKALFEDAAALKRSLDWFRPLTQDAVGQDAHLYAEVFTYVPPAG